MPRKALALTLALGCLACASRPHPPKATGTTSRGAEPQAFAPPAGSTADAQGTVSKPAEAPNAAVATVTPLLTPAPRALDDSGRWLLDEPRALKLEAFSPSGAWIAYCTGQSELFIAFSPAQSAPSLPRKADKLLAWSSDGSKLVLSENGSAILIDLDQRREVNLSPWNPDLESDVLPQHRSFAFSSSGETLAFLTARPTPELHWLDLKAPGEIIAHKSVTLPYVPWRIHLDDTLVELDGGEGGARWPVPRESKPALRCQTPRSRFAAYPDLSDPLARYRRSVRLLDLTKKDGPEAAPGFVMSLGKKWVRREPSGRLLVVDGRVQKQLASEKCGGRIRHADSQTGLFIVSCEHFVPEPHEPKDSKKNSKAKPEFRFQTYLLAPGYVRELEVSLPRVGFDRLPEPEQAGSRFVPLSDGTSSFVVDLKARTLLPLDPAARFLVSAGERAALLKAGHVVDFGSSGSTPAREGPANPGRAIDALSPVLVRGGFVYAEGALYHPARLPTPAPTGLVELSALGAMVSASTTKGDEIEGPLIIQTAVLPTPTAQDPKVVQTQARSPKPPEQSPRPR